MIISATGVLLSLIYFNLYREHQTSLPPPIVRMLVDRGNVLEFRQSNKNEPIWQDQEVESLSIQKVVDLEPFRRREHKLEKLRVLSLYDLQQDVDLSPIVGISSIRTLRVDSPTRVDLSPIARMNRLEALMLCNVSIESLAPLADLESLEYLWLTDVHVNELAPLGRIPELIELSLGLRQRNNRTEEEVSHNTNHYDLSGLVGSPNLRTLELSVDIEGIDELPDLPSLTQLSILDNPTLTDLNSINRFSQLRYLDVRGSRIFDLSPVTDLASLKYLLCSNTNVSDLSPLSTLPLLEALDLADTDVVDLSPLIGIAMLQEIKLSKPGDRELAMLAQVRSLRKIEIEDIAVNNLAALERLDQLDVLVLNGKVVSDSEKARFEATRPDVVVVNLYVSGYHASNSQ